MASKILASSTTLVLVLNLLFFSLVTSSHCPPPPCNCKPPKSPPPKHPKPPATPTPKPPATPTPKPPATPTPKPPATPTPKPPATPTPKPPAAPTPTTPPKCDALKLGVCANVLGGLIGLVLGTPEKKECCSLLQGVADLDAALCLCTALKANVLGINLNIPVDLSLLLNYCDKKTPKGFQCS